VRFKTHDHNAEAKHPYSYLQGSTLIHSGFIVHLLTRFAAVRFVTNQFDMSLPDKAHFDQSSCLKKYVGEPPSISMAELRFAPHKVKAHLDA
jgi:hypothetical protein